MILSNAYAFIEGLLEVQLLAVRVKGRAAELRKVAVIVAQAARSLFRLVD